MAVKEPTTLMWLETDKNLGTIVLMEMSPRPAPDSVSIPNLTGDLSLDTAEWVGPEWRRIQEGAWARVELSWRDGFVSVERRADGLWARKSR